MKLSQIKNLLSHSLPICDFKLAISQEMSEYVSKEKIKGSTRPVYLQEDINIYIGSSEAIFMLNAFIKSELSILEVNYIVDALLMSENVKFESETFLEELETMTDPEIQGIFTLERAVKLKANFSK
ncbi:MAG: hypothetical protein ACO1N9_06865 [Flavobacterium sp.]